MTCMNITIRDINENSFRKLKAKAAEENMKIGNAVTQAIEAWLQARERKQKGKLGSIKITTWGKGSEHSSAEVDKILYG